LLVLKKAKAEPIIAMIGCAMIIVSVMPLVGYHALPVTSQSNRLETLLIEEGMLVDGKIIPAATDPTIDKKEAITDSVLFLANAQDAKLPTWFDRDLNSSVSFLSRLGFEQAWPMNDGGINETYSGTFLTLPNATLDIGDYTWAIKMQIFKDGDQMNATIDGEQGNYLINWIVGNGENVPTLKIERDGIVIVDQDMNDYLDKILVKYPPGRPSHVQATQDDMTLIIDTADVRVLLVFSQVDINIDTQQDRITYWINLSDIYFYEKP